MTTGVLFFAFNTTGIDYIKIAQWNALNIQRHLNLPVSIVTDNPITNTVFDQVIYVENQRNSGRKIKNIENPIRWRNSGRHLAYKLTPYENTILLDVDYIVASNQLQTIISDPRPFICTQSAISVSNLSNDYTLYTKYKMPMSWATVIKFTKSEIAEFIFDMMRMVQTNYGHYATLFGFNSTPYRNDFALSIALTLASGHNISYDYATPFKLLNVNPGDEVYHKGVDTYEIRYNREVNNIIKPFKIEIKNQDLHIMSKDYLEKIIDS